MLSSSTIIVWIDGCQLSRELGSAVAAASFANLAVLTCIRKFPVAQNL